MQKIAALAFGLTSLLSGCGTVPTVHPPQVVTVCPRIPALPPLDPETQAALETDFTATIARLLSGLAPLATGSVPLYDLVAPATSGLKLK